MRDYELESAAAWYESEGRLLEGTVGNPPGRLTLADRVYSALSSEPMSCEELVTAMGESIDSVRAILTRGMQRGTIAYRNQPWGKRLYHLPGDEARVTPPSGVIDSELRMLSEAEARERGRVAGILSRTPAATAREIADLLYGETGKWATNRIQRILKSLRKPSESSEPGHAS